MYEMISHLPCSPEAAIFFPMSAISPSRGNPLVNPTRIMSDSSDRMSLDRCSASVLVLEEPLDATTGLDWLALRLRLLRLVGGATEVAADLD